MEAQRPPPPAPGRCPPPRAAGRDPAAAPVSVLAPPQVPGGGAPAALGRREDGVGAARAPGPGRGGRAGGAGSPLSLPLPQGAAVGGGFAGPEFAPPREPEPRAAHLGAPGARAGAAGGPRTPSAHVPVPAQRAPPGKSRLDEVMAAAALTSLSTSPLLLGAPAAACSPEPGLEPWKETLARPLGSCSSSSGDWGWDLASDQSSPSTPSPPLPSETAHFLFGEPAPRKRKSSVQVLFQCLWKRCGKVLSTASGMQRHIRLVHLGCGGAGRWGGGKPGGPGPQLPPVVSPAGGRQSRSRATVRRTSTTQSWTLAWTCWQTGCPACPPCAPRPPRRPPSPAWSCPSHPACPACCARWPCPGSRC
uniref:SLC2A4 regulator n=1 Tax=Canis lupus familiaris TaxID=9615 RepID=A0A8I3P8E7_CANLF